MKTDAELTRDVRTELLWELCVQDARVSVTVKDGVVTLAGQLDSNAQKSAVLRTVQRVSGVKVVEVELDVKPAAPKALHDTDIEEAAQYALSWSSQLPSDSVHLSVKDGWVTLDGELSWEFQRRCVERAIRTLIGVTGITNNICIKPQVAQARLKVKLPRASASHTPVEVEPCEIKNKNSEAVLNEAAHSWVD